MLIDQVREAYDIRIDSITQRYQYALKGFAAKLSQTQVETLKKDPRILKIKPNKLYSLGIVYKAKLNNYTPKTTFMMSQTTPWGVNRVGGPLDGTGKKAWILDTGIDLDHPDLNVDVANSASFIATESADDGNGHGTHVAGIIAAKDNSQNVVGVAAGATVVAVRVCFDEAPGPGQDQCPESSLLNGIDHVANNAQSGDITNISIWGPVDSDLDNAVINAANNGVRFTLISGNAGANANNFSPGRANNSNVWTVSAHDDNDNFASFSNYGNPPIEYGAPGVDVPSLWKNGGTNTISGTSMAAPHIAGLLLAAPNDVGVDGYVSNDPDNEPDAIAAYMPFTVSISGPNYLESGELGTWTANPVNGSGGYSYQWYYKNIGSSTWQTGGTSSSYSKYFNNSSSSTAVAGIRVVVSSGGEQAISTKNITIGGEDCPPGQICL